MCDVHADKISVLIEMSSFEFVCGLYLPQAQFKLASFAAKIQEAEAATEKISKISVLFFQGHLFQFSRRLFTEQIPIFQEGICLFAEQIPFFQEPFLCVHRTDADFSGATFLATKQMPIF